MAKLITTMQMGILLWGLINATCGEWAKLKNYEYEDLAQDSYTQT